MYVGDAAGRPKQGTHKKVIAEGQRTPKHKRVLDVVKRCLERHVAMATIATVSIISEYLHDAATNAESVSLLRVLSRMQSLEKRFLRFNHMLHPVYRSGSFVWQQKPEDENGTVI